MSTTEKPHTSGQAPERRAPESPESIAAPAPVRIDRPVLRALAWYTISRLVVVVATIPSTFWGDPGAGPWPTLPPENVLLRALGRWDGAWYIWVADRGYPTAHQFSHHLSEVAFFPLYPGVVRFLSSLTGWSELACGLLVALAAGALATVLFWHFANHLAGRAVADRAVLLFVFFPGSFALSMAYAECLMVAAAAGCLLALLRRQWVLAGLAGALATASRPNGAAVVVACMVAAGVEIHRRRDWRALLAPLLATGGVTAFFAALWLRTGHPLAWFESERTMWHDHIGYGQGVASRVAGLVTHLPSLRSGGLNDLVGVAGAGVVAASMVALWRWRGSVVVRAYTAMALLVPTLSVAVGPRPRMLFGAFPMAVLASERWTGRAHRTVVVISAVLLAALTVVITTSLASTP
jgi:hypothetical protein